MRLRLFFGSICQGKATGTWQCLWCPLPTPAAPLIYHRPGPLTKPTGQKPKAHTEARTETDGEVRLRSFYLPGGGSHCWCTWRGCRLRGRKPNQHTAFPEEETKPQQHRQSRSNERHQALRTIDIAIENPTSTEVGHSQLLLKRGLHVVQSHRPRPLSE
jgi:hypothetical protein